MWDTYLKSLALEVDLVRTGFGIALGIDSGTALVFREVAPGEIQEIDLVVQLGMALGIGFGMVP